MSTIIVTRSCLATATDHDQMTTIMDSKPLKMGIAGLLVSLGQKIIETGLPSEWLRMSQISQFCRRFRLSEGGRSTRVKDLDLPIRDYFEKHGEISSGGVRVEYKTEWNENRRRQEVFLRFRKMYPDGSCS